ncbi:hypothetical protein GE061_016036 [Apolygus lucorum]|uniref:Uncharacterized protein n=1 Tax=Apolygus lucorum TaxID=248454 RepID=A0A8S9XG80_APOLU|nr:hypothetical protein GE061_016036 [Apolygus lucorum]
MTSPPAPPPQKRRSGEADLVQDPTVNEEELKALVKRTMAMARGLPPRDRGQIITQIDKEPELAPVPPKKPQAKEDKKKKLPPQKKKQSIKKMSIKPKH